MTGGINRLEKDDPRGTKYVIEGVAADEITPVYVISYADDKLYVDLAAERAIAAERNGHKIAVEIKSFVGRSPLHDFEVALGQYLLYLGLLERTEPERKLYLAINHLVYHSLFQQPIFQTIVRRFHISLLVVNIVSQEVEQWID